MTIVCAGCFRISLSDRVAAISGSTGVIDSAVVDFERTSTNNLAHDYRLVDEVSSLGHQFALGIFPVTRLRFEGTARRYFEEVMLSQLLERVATVYLLEPAQSDDPAPKRVKTIAACLPGSIRISASLLDLAVNGYDAIFFRILSVTGVFEFSSSNQAPITHYDFENSRYALYAHAPDLEGLLYQTLLQRLRKVEFPRRIDLYSECKNIQKPETLLKTAREPVMVVMPPRIDQPDSKLMTSLLSRWGLSYGFRNGVRFGKSEAQRVIQRGIANSVRSNGISTVSLLGQIPPPQSFEKALSAGDSFLISNLSILDPLNSANDGSDFANVEIRIHFQLLDQTGRTVASAVVSSRDEMNTLDQSDGGVGRFLELSAQRLFHRFFTETPLVNLVRQDSPVLLR